MFLPLIALACFVFAGYLALDLNLLLENTPNVPEHTWAAWAVIGLLIGIGILCLIVNTIENRRRRSRRTSSTTKPQRRRATRPQRIISTDWSTRSEPLQVAAVRTDKHDGGTRLDTFI